jgi:hypothetical protein
MDCRFYLPSKKVVLLIFIAVAQFEPANFRSSGEHDNHYTADGDFI